MFLIYQQFKYWQNIIVVNTLNRIIIFLTLKGYTVVFDFVFNIKYDTYLF